MLSPPCEGDSPSGASGATRGGRAPPSHDPAAPLQAAIHAYSQVSAGVAPVRALQAVRTAFYSFYATAPPGELCALQVDASNVQRLVQLCEAAPHVFTRIEARVCSSVPDWTALYQIHRLVGLNLRRKCYNVPRTARCEKPDAHHISTSRVAHAPHATLAHSTAPKCQAAGRAPDRAGQAVGTDAPGPSRVRSVSPLRVRQLQRRHLRRRRHQHRGHAGAGTSVGNADRIECSMAAGYVK